MALLGSEDINVFFWISTHQSERSCLMIFGMEDWKSNFHSGWGICFRRRVIWLHRSASTCARTTSLYFLPSDYCRSGRRNWQVITIVRTSMIDGWTVSMHFHSNYIYVIFLQPAGVLITSSKLHSVCSGKQLALRWLAQLWVRYSVRSWEDPCNECGTSRFETCSQAAISCWWCARIPSGND